MNNYYPVIILENDSFNSTVRETTMCYDSIVKEIYKLSNYDRFISAEFYVSCMRRIGWF